MKNTRGIAETLKKTAGGYGLDTTRIEALERQQNEGKVCVPVIGRFSSGKSSLLNTLLGYGSDILEVDIKPETAVPTELVYTDNEEAQQVSLCCGSGVIRHYSVQEYVRQEIELDAGAVKSVRLTLNSEGLEAFPDLCLVDMPGFESGIEAHNRSIDGYVEKSMAYLITFAADGDMILKETMGNILKELCRYDMPIMVVITKRDKVDDEEDYEKKKAKLKGSLKDCLGKRPMGWCDTSSHEEQIASFREELGKLQDRAEDLRRKRFCALVRPEAAVIRDYLKTRLGGISLSESELAGKERELQAQIAEQKNHLNGSARGFRSKLGSCTWNIQNYIQDALCRAEKAAVDMALCGQENSIGDYLNTVVRDALAVGIERFYIPVVKEYIQDVSMEGIDPVPGIYAALTEVNVEESGIAGPIIAGVVASVLTLPIIGLLVAGIFGIANKVQDDKKRKRAEHQIRGELNSKVFPNILRQVAEHLRTELENHSEGVIQSIMEQGNARTSALEQSLAAVKDDIHKEQTRKERDIQMIQADLALVEGILNEL